MPDPLHVTSVITIPDTELSESFILSSGAGGQNVNKVASAVQLRLDVLHSARLPDDVRVRLLRLGGHRLTKDGVLIITARESRDQKRNREIARERLGAADRRAAGADRTRELRAQEAQADEAVTGVERAPDRFQEARRADEAAAVKEVRGI